MMFFQMIFQGTLYKHQSFCQNKKTANAEKNADPRPGYFKFQISVLSIAQDGISKALLTSLSVY